MTLRADEQGRLTSIKLFPPNTVFNAVSESDGSIRLEPLAAAEVPVVEPIRTPEGFLMLPIKIDRSEFAAAIRKDRDAQ